MTIIVKLGQHGRMIIPAEVRHTLGLKEGDELLLSIGDKRLVPIHSAVPTAGSLSPFPDSMQPICLTMLFEIRSNKARSGRPPRTNF